MVLLQGPPKYGATATYGQLASWPPVVSCRVTSHPQMVPSTGVQGPTTQRTGNLTDASFIFDHYDASVLSSLNGNPQELRALGRQGRHLCWLTAHSMTAISTSYHQNITHQPQTFRDQNPHRRHPLSRQSRFQQLLIPVISVATYIQDGKQP